MFQELVNTLLPEASNDHSTSNWLSRKLPNDQTSKISWSLSAAFSSKKPRPGTLTTLTSPIVTSLRAGIITNCLLAEFWDLLHWVLTFLRFEGKAASRNMRGLEGRRLPCGTEVRLRQRGAGTPPSPSTLPLLLLLPLRLPLRPVLVSCTVALLGVTHSHAHCVFLVLYSFCFFLRRFNRSSLP